MDLLQISQVAPCEGLSVSYNRSPQRTNCDRFLHSVTVYVVCTCKFTFLDFPLVARVPWFSTELFLRVRGPMELYGC